MDRKAKLNIINLKRFCWNTTKYTTISNKRINNYKNNMKIAIVFAALFAVALAAPAQDYAHAEVLRLESDVRPEGYNFA